MITDTASHCWCRVSSNPPRIHKKSIKRRGTDFMSELRFCFTVYVDIEQLEPGDTTTHTFIVLDWPYCTTKYFYFWGSIDGVTCVSTSPPFHYHNAYIFIPPWGVVFFIEPWSHMPSPFGPVYLIFYEPWGVPELEFFLFFTESWSDGESPFGNLRLIFYEFWG
ncbi:hypothetical protein ES705_27029 [subsurface metagenome]